MLRNRLRDARRALTEQKAAFDELTESLDPVNVKQWEAQAKEWEADPFNRDDPYLVENQGISRSRWSDVVLIADYYCT